MIQRVVPVVFPEKPVNARCFEAEVILDEPNESGELPRWEA